MKYPPGLKPSDLEAEAAIALRSVLSEVPFVRNVDVKPEYGDRRFDVVARLDVGDGPRTIVVEVKTRGQPRDVRVALYQLRDAIDSIPGATAIFVAPYLSEEARRLCQEAGVGYLDLEGNCRITFDSVFIDRVVPHKPPSAKRELKSLFKPKSSQVLRALLRDPQRIWRVVELAETAGVSLGHVSNVRTALLDREWAEADAEGLRLKEPNALLDAWRDDYETPPGLRLSLYTPLQGPALNEALRSLLAGPGKSALAAHSAAQWLAPFGRQKTVYLYVDQNALVAAQNLLRSTRPTSGGNLVVTRLRDDGLFRDSVEPAEGFVTTSPVQTYLDLWQLGERGQEAAEHLRRERLPWSS